MQRNLQKLTGRTFDLLIVGGGIYGAAAAREAALCGLDVALIERGDFCRATSANSLKIIHGGLRYLQQFDIVRVRESIVERRNMMVLAPHLVHPLPCMMPTRGMLMKSKPVMALGMLMNDIISFDRNRLADPEKTIPRGRIMSRDECLRVVPGLEGRGVTGAAIWHDAYAYNSERLVLGLVGAAVAGGCAAANYVSCTGFLRDGERIAGVTAHDELGGEDIEISARLVINNTGPWSAQTLALPGGIPRPLPLKLAMGMNVISKRLLIEQYAVGLQAQSPGRPSRLLFLMPWHGRTLAGTYYRMHDGPPEALQLREQDIDLFLDDINDACPPARLQGDDIALIHAGLLPADPPARPGAEPRLHRHYRLIDHADEDDVQGLITAIGVKYTTARDVAERTLRLALKKLGDGRGACADATQPLPGGEIEDVAASLADAVQGAPDGLDEACMQRLVFNYGTRYGAVLEPGKQDRDLLRPLSPNCGVLGAEVLFAVRREMAVRLSDVVFRRTDLASTSLDDETALSACAELMASELDWTAAQREAEMAGVRSRKTAWEGL